LGFTSPIEATFNLGSLIAGGTRRSLADASDASDYGRDFLAGSEQSFSFGTYSAVSTVPPTPAGTRAPAVASFTRRPTFAPTPSITASIGVLDNTAIAPVQGEKMSGGIPTLYIAVGGCVVALILAAIGAVVWRRRRSKGQRVAPVTGTDTATAHQGVAKAGRQERQVVPSN